MSQNQAKMQLNWNLAQESGHTGNIWDGEKVGMSIFMPVPYCFEEASGWEKMPKDVKIQN